MERRATLIERGEKAMKEKHKANKKKRESLREALKKKLGNWSPEPSQKPSSNIKTPA